MKHALNMPDISACPYCEIDRLMDEVKRLNYQMVNWPNLFDENMVLNMQLEEATRILKDVRLISPGQPGHGDLSREQRTLADVARFVRGKGKE
jgi:hypothetical protein